MRQRWMKACAVLAVLWSGWATALEAPAVSLSPEPHHARTAKIAAAVLAKHHYASPEFDDAFSARVFDNYLDVLDPDKVVLLQSDIDSFASARSRLDDALEDEDLRVPFALYNRYRDRQIERFTYAQQLLKTPFDFTEPERIDYNRKTARWPKTLDEARDRWRKRVKNDWLRLRLAGQKDAAIRATLDKRYEGYLTRLGKTHASDVFQTYLDAVATAVDPHTNYLGPKASEEFDIAMRLSLIGIGAVLQTRDEYTAIRELVPGGPAALSGKLKVGDRIVGVGQGQGAPLTEVLGWRLDDVVSQIRGELDSVVVLDVLPADAGPDGKRKLITLTRKKISIEAQAARKAIIPVRDGKTVRRIGVITLPSFYEDFDARRRGDANFRSAARDVSRLIGELKRAKVEGLVIDLRNNGGGSLPQAVEITGLFIDQGPVVQQRDARGKVGIESDTAAGYGWNGPMAVLVNRFSASASEIFAAAIQDYGRGVVLGEPSFGKGTVQSIVNLDRMFKTDKPLLGEVKLTIAEFYRVNGNTTQLRGVTPDIAFPLLSDMEQMGESSFDNALPAGRIAPVSYLPAGSLGGLIPELRTRHQKRLATDPGLKRLAEDAAELAALRRRTSVSLLESERRAERDALEAREKRRAREEAARGGRSAQVESMADDGLLASERAPETGARGKRGRNAARDVLLTESARIVGDTIAAMRRDPKLAAQAAPRALRVAGTR